MYVYEELRLLTPIKENISVSVSSVTLLRKSKIYWIRDRG